MDFGKDFFKQEGDRSGDFLLVRRAPIDELQLVLSEIIHVPSGDAPRE